jgi:hypothetical protein
MMMKIKEGKIMNKKNLKTIAMILGISMLWTAPLFAWGESNPRAMAMGGAYTALSTGLEAAAYNPANLGLSINRSFSLDLIGFGISVKNNSFSLADYNEYTGQFLDEGDKDAIMNKIPSEGLQLNLLTEVKSMSFSVGRFALSFRSYGASKLSLDRDPFELLLYGNAVKSEVNLDETSGEAYAIGDGSLSYGHPVKKWADGELAIGATAHYLYGIAYEKIIHAQGGVATTDDGFVGDGTMIVRSGLGGSGFAFDVGASMIFHKDWIFSASWQNMYSQINWSGQPEEMMYTFIMDPINFDNLSDEDSDSLVESTDTTYDVAAFKSKLPSIFKIGIARNYKKLTWAIDWEQGTSNNTTQAVTPRIGAGLEYRLVNFLPVRVGTAFGGDRGSVYSAGFGAYIGPFHLDFAAANNGSFNPNATKGAYFAFAMGLRF